MRANLRKSCIHSGRYSFDSIFKIYVKMFVSMKKRRNLKVGQVGSETRSLGQILKNYMYILEGIVLIQSA